MTELVNQPRLKPLVFRLHQVMQGQPDAYIGEGILVPHHQEGSHFWASALVKREGSPIAWLTLNGAPISKFPFESTNPPGRPRADTKRIAAWLAWHIHFRREGKKGLADGKTGVRFGYSVPDDDELAAECKTVRDIRNTTIKNLIPAQPNYEVGIQLDVQGQAGSAAYIEKPTFYMRDGQLELLGMAWVWHESWDTEEATYRAIRLTSKIENLDGDTWEKWRSKEGPMLFVIA